MSIKLIKLSPKKGGTGVVSSFSVNIGNKEAEKLGFLDKGSNIGPIIKLLNYETRELIIKRKTVLITEEIVSTVIKLADEANKDFGTAYSSPFSFQLSPPTEEEKKLDNYLSSLSFEVLTDLTTLMYLGRDRDINMELSSYARFIDYWTYLADIGIFTKTKEILISDMIEKAPLANYLRTAIIELSKPALPATAIVSPDSGDDDFDSYSEDNWL